MARHRHATKEEVVEDLKAQAAEHYSAATRAPTKSINRYETGIAKGLEKAAIQVDAWEAAGFPDWPAERMSADGTQGLARYRIVGAIYAPNRKTAQSRLDHADIMIDEREIVPGEGDI
jgi:hypothetical protein